MVDARDVKIVIVNSEDPFEAKASGGAAYARNLWRALRALNYRTTFVGIGTHTGERQGADFVSLAASGRTPSWLFAFLLLRLRGRISFAEPTVIHVQRPEFALPLRLAFPAIPLMVTIHGDILSAYSSVLPFPLNRLYAMLYGICLRMLDEIAFVDDETLRSHAISFPAIKSRFKRVEVLVDTTVFHYLPQGEARRIMGIPQLGRILLFVGRIAPEKNLQFLIEVWRRMKAEDPGLAFRLAGDGPDRRAVMLEAEDLTLLWQGVEPPDRVSLTMSSADALCLASHREGSPTVVREALCCGLPVISADVGDVDSTLREMGLRTVSPLNVKDYIGAIKVAWAMTPEARKALSERAIRAYGIRASVARHCEIYSSLARIASEMG